MRKRKRRLNFDSKIIFLVLILGLEGVFITREVFAVDSVIRNNTGDLEISTKATDGRAVHVRSK